MSEHRQTPHTVVTFDFDPSAAALVVCAFLFTVLVLGSPDLLDAIIHRVAPDLRPTETLEDPR